MVSRIRLYNKVTHSILSISRQLAESSNSKCRSMHASASQFSFHLLPLIQLKNGLQSKQEALYSNVRSMPYVKHIDDAHTEREREKPTAFQRN